MFCTNCGKEVADGAAFCSACGQPLNSFAGNNNFQAQANNSYQAQVNNNHQVPRESVVIKGSYAKLFGISMLGGLVYGLLMGVFMMGFGIPFVAMFLFGGLLFGLLFFGGMAIAVSSLEKKANANFRYAVAQRGAILFEGAANRAGNGGWLYVTQSGIEHHVHKMNFNSQPTIIPHEQILSVRKVGGKIEVRATQYSCTFVVDRPDQWMYHFYQCDLTKNKIG